MLFFGGGGVLKCTYFGWLVLASRYLAFLGGFSLDGWFSLVLICFQSRCHFWVVLESQEREGTRKMTFDQMGVVA